MKVPYERFWPAQLEFIHAPRNCNIDMAVYQGGVGSTSGSAVLRDCETGESFTMQELWESGKPITVQAIDSDGNAVKAKTLPPVREGIGSLYRVEMESGYTIEVTASHRFLKVDTWVELCDLNPGDDLVIGESVLSGPCEVEYAHLLSSHTGSPASYCLDQSQYDGPPLQAKDRDQAFLPQQLYTLADFSPSRSVSGHSSHPHKSDSASLMGSPSLSQLLEGVDLYPYSAESPSALPLQISPLCGQSQLLNNQTASTCKSYPASVVSGDGIPSHDECHDDEELWIQKIAQCPVSGQSLFGMVSFREAATPAAQAVSSDLSFGASACPFRLDKIKSITYIKEDYYFDVHVPKYNNYLCNGFINHNSGKTFIGALLGLILASRLHGKTGMVVGKEYVLIRDTTLVTYREHLERFGWKEGKDWIWRAEEKMIVLPKFGNAKILFRHLENPEKIKSLNLAWIHVEEMSQITEADFLMLISRLRQEGVKTYRLFGTTNPEPEKGWLFNHFNKNAGAFEVKTPEGENVRIVRRRVIAPTTDNKALPASYIENLKKSYDENYYRQYVLGHDVDSRDGLVCSGWSVANEDLTVEYNPDWPIYLTCDFNVDPMCWVLAHRVRRPSDGLVEYWYFDEQCLPTITTHDAAQAIADKYRNHTAGIIVTGDASGSARRVEQEHISKINYNVILNVLTQNGIRNVKKNVPSKNPGVRTRIETWNAMVKPLVGSVRIRANPDKCRWLVWNMNNMKWVEGGEGAVVREPTSLQIARDVTNTLKYTKHPFDAASYLVVQYDPIQLHSDIRSKNVYRELTYTPEHKLAPRFRPGH